MASVTEFYTNSGEFYNKVYDLERAHIKDAHSYLLTETTWYHLLRNEKYNEEMIDFYLNDPYYKNIVARYKFDNRNGGIQRRYQTYAMSLFLHLREELNIEMPLDPTITAMLGKAKGVQLEKYIGTYNNDVHGIADIQSKAGYLTYNNYVYTFNS